MWDYARAALQSRAIDSESYPNLVSSLETQLGELVALVFITLHRSPALGAISLHPVRSEPSCNDMTHFTTKPEGSVIKQNRKVQFTTNKLIKLSIILVIYVYVLIAFKKRKERQRHQVRHQMTLTVHLLFILRMTHNISSTSLHFWD